MMEFLTNFDSTLDTLAKSLGHWIYVVVFLTIFAETGLVVMPFLPGDSLLFAIGILCAREDTDLRLEVFLTSLVIASFIGNYTNFLIGRALVVRVGGKPGIESAGIAVGRLFGGKFARFAKPSDLVRADAVFRKWGLLAVTVSRFLPFLRTLIPFVAGISDMRQGPFLLCSAIGGMAWVGVCTLAGYWAGNIPWVKANFTFFIMAMFVFGFIPIAVSSGRKWLLAKRLSEVISVPVSPELHVPPESHGGVEVKQPAGSSSDGVGPEVASPLLPAHPDGKLDNTMADNASKVNTASNLDQN